MKQFLKQYRVRLHTVGPVFIGSGREYSKKEYVILSNSKVGILDMQKLYSFLIHRRRTQSFENYMLNMPKEDLHDWLKKEGIEKQEIQNCMKFVIDAGDTSIQHGTKASIIDFIKDPMGRPYVPGSSLKGMFRTLLLTKSLEENAKK